jgi:hypothetical protein
MRSESRLSFGIELSAVVVSGWQLRAAVVPDP